MRCEKRSGGNPPPMQRGGGSRNAKRSCPSEQRVDTGGAKGIETRKNDPEKKKKLEEGTSLGELP